jgi:GDPmannose 4,6-dehydratase
MVLINQNIIHTKLKKALITGITGQDGAYLAALLLNKGYEVHGLRRRSSLFNTSRIDKFIEDDNINNKKFFLHYADMTDSLSIVNLINKFDFDEIYNLAAQSHVGISFKQPEYTANVDAVGVLRILEAIKNSKNKNITRFYQASTSELYGGVYKHAQSESTPFYPKSPYAVAKLMGYWATINYREAYNIFAVNGVLFNHESPLRGETFVTRKITRGLSRILLGLQSDLILGNLDAKRDWGHAKEYVELMWLMLQHKEPIDLVAATSVQKSIREFIEICCDYIGLEIEWNGKGLSEVCKVKKVIPNKLNKDCQIKKGHIIIKISEEYFRASEVNTLLGDASLAKKTLGWEPKLDINYIAKEMIDNDCKLANDEFLIKSKNK